jgi:hypothetical protein
MNDTPLSPLTSPLETVDQPVQPIQTPHPVSPNTPGIVILQWLSYAFWGWLILALIWLIVVILLNAISEVSTKEVVPYAIAATVVLFPVAFLTDFFYRKHEPIKKVGIAMVIMVIHAVLFALLAIVSLIVAVFNGLNAAIEASANTDAQKVLLYASLFATALYAITFIRTLNPFKSKKPTLIYGLLMTGVTTLLIILAIVGPLALSITTKDDRRIEANLGGVSQSINDYIQSNNKLPESLNDVTYTSDESEGLVKDNLVQYQKEQSIAGDLFSRTTEHRYQLCVSYKAKDSSSSYYSTPRNNNRYMNYLSTSGHAKGEVCYKLSETTRAESTTNSVNVQSMKLN